MTDGFTYLITSVSFLLVRGQGKKLGDFLILYLLLISSLLMTLIALASQVMTAMGQGFADAVGIAELPMELENSCMSAE
jgi:hypothetical protein